MDTTFISSENSKTQPRIIILKLTDKLGLKRGEKSITFSNLRIYCTWKNIKSSYNKYQLQHRMINLNYLADHILYQIFKIFVEYILKKRGENTDNPSVKIYVNKIKNRIVFKIKNGYSLKLLTPETMKLLGGTKNKIDKDKNGENVPHFEITEVVLVHCNIVNNHYQQDPRVLYICVSNKPFGSLLEISPTNFIPLKTFNSEF